MKRIPLYGLFLLTFNEALAQSPEVVLSKTPFKRFEHSADHIYTVKAGDSLSVIVNNHRHLAPHLSFKKHLNIVIKKNNIQNAALIEVGQKFSLSTVDIVEEKYTNVHYPVKYGDTLFEVLASFYGKSHFKNVLPHVLDNNPSIKNINFITAGSTINLPSRSVAQNLIHKSRAVASIRSNTFKLLIDPRTKEEISFLSKAEAKNYKVLYENIMKTNTKKDLIVELKDLLELSRTLDHEYLENTFLQLITSTLKSRESEAHLSDLRHFFLTWKDSRIKANSSI